MNNFPFRIALQSILLASFTYSAISHADNGENTFTNIKILTEDSASARFTQARVAGSESTIEIFGTLHRDHILPPGKTGKVTLTVLNENGETLLERLVPLRRAGNQHSHELQFSSRIVMAEDMAESIVLTHYK